MLTTFEYWVQEGISRRDAQNKLKALIETYLVKQSSHQSLPIDLEQVHWDQIAEFLCTCHYRKRLHDPLPNIPSETLWEKLADDKHWAPLSSHPQMNKAIKETVPVPYFPLERKLLSLGGTHMVYRREPDLESLLNRGEAFDEPAELVPGESRACHTNSAQMWNHHKETLAI